MCMIPKLFDYLEDRALQVDKNGIYECIMAIVAKLFSEFCNSMAGKPKDKERDRNLEAIAVILLIEFNNPNKTIRKHADTFLTELVNRFPHLLWSKSVLYGMLNALHQFSQCFNVDEIQVKRHNFELSLWLYKLMILCYRRSTSAAWSVKCPYLIR